MPTRDTPIPASIRIAVVASQFNPGIVNGLQDAAIRCLAQEHIPIGPEDVFAAPGAFELPLIAQALARSGRYDGVICLGCVIKGDTAHFEFISAAASFGLMQASLASGVPIGFGVLTTYDEAQARARCEGDAENKGREAAAAVVQAVRTLREISATVPETNHPG